MTSWTRVAVQVVVACAILSSPVHAQHVRDTSYVAPDGSRVLQYAIIIPATLGDVWDAFTTVYVMPCSVRSGPSASNPNLL